MKRVAGLGCDEIVDQIGGGGEADSARVPRKQAIWAMALARWVLPRFAEIVSSPIVYRYTIWLTIRILTRT
jgi:hypothetical protein